MAKEYTIPDECQACIHPIHAINGVFCTWLKRYVDYCKKAPCEKN